MSNNNNLPPKKWIEEQLEKDRKLLEMFGITTTMIDDPDNYNMRLIADFSTVRCSNKTLCFGYNK